jgi:hypothetical protein
MSSRRQRLRYRAYNIVWADNSGSTADRDTDCDDFRDSNRISLSQLGNTEPHLKSDCLA